MADEEHVRPSLRERCDPELHALALRAYAADGSRVVVLLGLGIFVENARGVVATRFEPDTRDELLLYAQQIVEREAVALEDLLRGYVCGWRSDPGPRLVIRLATLEERARHHARQLRAGGGTALRRADADQVATVLETLARRSARRTCARPRASA